MDVNNAIRAGNITISQRGIQCFRRPHSRSGPCGNFHDADESRGLGKEGNLKKGNLLVFQGSDSGQGVHFNPRIFDPFYTVLERFFNDDSRACRRSSGLTDNIPQAQ